MFTLSRLTRAGMAALIAGLALPALAAGGAVSIKNISNGQKITASTIPVEVNVSDFKLECQDAGKPGTPGRGHIHAMVDGTDMAHLTNFYCSDKFDISGAALKPGKHTLAVVLSDDAHMMVGKPAMTMFDYQPKEAAPLPQPDTDAKPSVRIISPKKGAVLGSKFNLVLAVNDFNLSCGLEGKADVKGYGHLHVFVTQKGVTDKMHTMKKMSAVVANTGMKNDKMGGMGSEGMMSMVGMIGMPCTKTVPVDLSTWHPGKANVLVMLANNDHMPAMGTAPSSITVTIK